MPFSKPDNFLEGMFKCLGNKIVYSLPANSPAPHIILFLGLSANFRRLLRVVRALSSGGWLEWPSVTGIGVPLVTPQRLVYTVKEHRKGNN